MKYLKYFESNKFDLVDSKNFHDVIKFVLEDDSLTNEYKSAIIGAITELPEKYRKKVYASRIIYHEDIDSKKHPVKAGDKNLCHIGISDVGKYWEHSDLPELQEHLKLYGLDIRYSHEYHYVLLEPSEGLDKYLLDVAKRYNL